MQATPASRCAALCDDGYPCGKGFGTHSAYEDKMLWSHAPEILFELTKALGGGCMGGKKSGSIRQAKLVAAGAGDLIKPYRNKKWAASKTLRTIKDILTYEAVLPGLDRRPGFLAISTSVMKSFAT